MSEYEEDFHFFLNIVLSNKSDFDSKLINRTALVICNNSEDSYYSNTYCLQLLISKQYICVSANDEYADALWLMFMQPVSPLQKCLLWWWELSAWAMCLASRKTGRSSSTSVKS